MAVKAMLAMFYLDIPGKLQFTPKQKPATLENRDLPAAESASLFKMKPARSTEFPLRRLAVRGCERTMSGA